MPKIVHIIPALGIGGAERMLVDLINNSEGSAWQHEIIVFFSRLDLAKELHDQNIVHIVPKKGKISLGLISDLQKKLRELKADVVHTHLFGGDCWGRIAAHRLGLPVVTTEHNVNEDEGWLKNFVRTRLRRYSDYYVAVSEEVKKYLLGLRVRRPVAVIHNGIVLKRFLTIPEPKLVGEMRMLILGRLVEQKGHIVAIRALAKLKQYDWSLTIMGSGEAELFLKNEVRALGLEERIKFVSPVIKIEEILPDYDMVLMPSLWEGLGIVALEAMTASRILLVSDCAGLKEVTRGRKNNVVAHAGDVDDWTKKLLWIWKNVAELKNNLSADRDSVKNNFSVEKMCAEYTAVYNLVANKAKSKTAI